MHSLLAFLLTIQTEKFQFGDLEKQLLAQLQLGPDWQAVQDKLAEILIANPELKTTNNHFKTQLEKQPNLLALLPKLNVKKQPITRSGTPGEPERETTEINNTAVAIAIAVIKSDNPTEKSKQLLQPLKDNLTLPDRK